MNNVFIYCELTEENTIADVSLELCSKGRKLASDLGVKLEAIVIGNVDEKIAEQLKPYGVDILHLATDKRLSPYTNMPHASIICKLFEQENPEIALFGATSVGRDLLIIFLPSVLIRAAKTAGITLR